MKQDKSCCILRTCLVFIPFNPVCFANAGMLFESTEKACSEWQAGEGDHPVKIHQKKNADNDVDYSLNYAFA